MGRKIEQYLHLLGRRRGQNECPALGRVGSALCGSQGHRSHHWNRRWDILRAYRILTITQIPTSTLTAASPTAAYKVMRSGSSMAVPDS